MHHCTRTANNDMCLQKVPARAGQSESVFQRGGPESVLSLARNVPNKQPSVLRKDSVMLAACLL